MSNRFYGNDGDSAELSNGPLVPAVVKSSPELKTTVLPNGNQIIQSLQLTETLRRCRNTLINQIDSIKAEWGTQKSAARNELASTKEYLEKNIFTDIYENQELLVPSSILSLGAFFCGRVLSNKNNWGSKSSLMTPRVSVLGRVLSSIPARLVLPFALAGTVFHQITPVSSENLWNTVERDALPRNFVDAYHRLWRDYYIQGVHLRKEQFYDNVYDSLQRNIRSLRKNISNNFKN